MQYLRAVVSRASAIQVNVPMSPAPFMVRRELHQPGGASDSMWGSTLYTFMVKLNHL